MAHLDSWIIKAKVEQESARGHRDQQLQQDFLQVPSCMRVFLTSFGMHDICMWIIGHDLSLAWRIAWIDNGSPWIAMEIVGLFPYFLWLVLMFP